ncbi:MAG TPA: glycosyltransferase family 4 protein [Terriglobales bacterium]
MKLLLLTEIIAPYRIPVFNALAQEPQIDLHVIFLAETDPASRQWHVYKSEIQFGYEVLPSWRTKLGSYKVLLNHRLSQAFDRAAPDVVLCGGYNYLASWQAQRWAKRRKSPFLLWSESTTADQRSLNFVIESLKKSFFSRCDGFVVPGTSAKKYAQQMGAPADSIFVAPNAVDNALFSFNAAAARGDDQLRESLGLPPRYFLYVGRLVKSKGVFELLQAYASLSEDLRSEIGLVIVGDGPVRAELQTFASTVSTGTVHFSGFVHREKLAACYALAECFVFPTHTDTWGLVVNEALACGLPVICSTVAGCAADLVTEKNGATVAPHRASDLARVMQEIANSPDLRRRMSLQSQEIIQNYSPERCALGIAEAALAMCRSSAATTHSICSTPLCRGRLIRRFAPRESRAKRTSFGNRDA